MTEISKGILILIGGGEDKTGDSAVLRQAAEKIAPDDRLTVLTTATESPEEAGATYCEVFRKIGHKNVSALNINTRRDANDEAMCGVLRESRGIFITGGDQLRLTSILGGTRACGEIKALYLSGGVLMGTSAGASVMSSTMVVQGNDLEPARKCTLKMAPGLGLLDDVIVDQHFDQRGRFGRLLCGVAENPSVLGLGIDEDTAVQVFPDGHFEVAGSNAVTVIDGSAILSSNVSELKPDELLAITGVTVHTLPAGYGYDLIKREVLRLKQDKEQS